MKPKTASKTAKPAREQSGSVLKDLHFHLHNYLEALKSLSDNKEYHHLVR